MQDQSLHPVKIFYCYAPEDQALQEELSRHLSPLRRLRDITTWVDRNIQAGAEWRREKEAHIETAHVILLLLSADFMASDYCYTVEMARALERHKAGTAHIIPILLRPVEWEKTPLGGLSALPVGNKPVTQWADRDAAWFNIVQGIHDLIRTLLPKNLLSPQATVVLYPEQEMSSRQRTGQQPAGRLLRQRYRLLHTVGQGGMGAVYMAQDTQLGDRLVAVKEMSTSRLSPQDLPQAVEQFRREAHLLASLQHPHLPVIYEYFREDDRWYLVMSFIEGQNLQAALDAAPGNRLPVNEVVRIGIELCEVLEYLHTHEPQVIFRDLKPLNIMLTPKGHICLIDFGIARHFKQEQIKDTAYYYSVGYAPPEQYGRSQTGPQSDIYSLGATLHQMLSGHHPASKPFQFSNLQLIDPTMPVPLVKVITQMLEMKEQERPASVSVVKAQLTKIVVPSEIDETQKAGEREKGKEDVFVDPSKRKPFQQIALIWGKIDNFLGKSRWIAWICFVILSLTVGSVLPWFAWQAGRMDNHPLVTDPMSPLPFTISNAGLPSDRFPPWITIIGAIGVAGIGLIFLLQSLLLKKRLFSLDLVGGIIVICIAFVNFTLSQYKNYYDNYFDYTQYYFQDSSKYFFNSFIFFVLFSLWLWVGVYFCYRSAKVKGRLLLGILLIIGGFSLLLPQGDFTLSLLTLLPALIWVGCGSLITRTALREIRSAINAASQPKK